jgi:hypothetical protein
MVMFRLPILERNAAGVLGSAFGDGGAMFTPTSGPILMATSEDLTDDSDAAADADDDDDDGCGEAFE